MPIESYSDGSGRNSKGYGSASFIIVKDNSIMSSQSVPLEGLTNNQAEYAALTNAAVWLVHQGIKEFTCYVDSELVAKQVNGDYKINSPELEVAVKNFQLIVAGSKVQVKWVPRTNKFIQVVDKMNRRTVRLVSK